MGFVKQSLMIGTIGNMVITQDGVVKSKPCKRKKSESPKVKANNQRFKGTVNLYNKIKHTIVKPIWQDDKSKRLNRFNIFIKRNIDAFDSEGNLKDPKMLTLTAGELPVPFSVEKVRDDVDNKQGTITVRWFNDKADDARRLDDRLCLIYLTANSFSPVCETEFMRKDSKVHLPVYCKGEKSSYIYIFFKEENYGIGSQDRFSDSVCIKTED